MLDWTPQTWAIFLKDPTLCLGLGFFITTSTYCCTTFVFTRELKKIRARFRSWNDQANAETTRLLRAERMTELESSYLELTRQLQAKEAELEALKQKSKHLIPVSTRWNENSYTTENGDGLFCSDCWTEDKEVSTLKRLGSFEIRTCPRCQRMHSQWLRE